MTIPTSRPDGGNDTPQQAVDALYADGWDQGAADARTIHAYVQASAPHMPADQVEQMWAAMDRVIAAMSSRTLPEPLAAAVAVPPVAGPDEVDALRAENAELRRAMAASGGHMHEVDARHDAELAGRAPAAGPDDELQTRLERVCWADDDGREYEHVDGCQGEPTCPACWAEEIRAVLAAVPSAGLPTPPEAEVTTEVTFTVDGPPFVRISRGGVPLLVGYVVAGSPPAAAGVAEETGR